MRSHDHLHPAIRFGFVRRSGELFVHGLDQRSQGLHGQQALLLQVGHGPDDDGLQVFHTGTAGCLFHLLTDTRPRQAAQGLFLLLHSQMGRRLETRPAPLGMEVLRLRSFRLSPLCMNQFSVYRIATEQRYTAHQ